MSTSEKHPISMWIPAGESSITMKPLDKNILAVNMTASLEQLDAIIKNLEMQYMIIQGVVPAKAVEAIWGNKDLYRSVREAK